MLLSIKSVLFQFLDLSNGRFKMVDVGLPLSRASSSNWYCNSLFYLSVPSFALWRGSCNLPSCLVLFKIKHKWDICYRPSVPDNNRGFPSAAVTSLPYQLWLADGRNRHFGQYFVTRTSEPHQLRFGISPSPILLTSQFTRSRISRLLKILQL